MKKDLLLFAGLGLIGYGLFKFLSPRSSSTGLGSNFLTNGTARIPTSLGAAKPGSAPVYGGYSTAPGGRAAAPQGGTDILPLITGGIAVGRDIASFLAEQLARFRGKPVVRDGFPTDQTLTSPPGAGGVSYGAPGYSPHYGPDADAFNFDPELNFSAALDAGFDGFDTSGFEGQA